MKRLLFSPPKKSPIISIKGSKSETNRLLILQALGHSITFSNPSSSEDTQLLREALKSRRGVVDIGMAGTAMRFLSAYYAASAGVEVTLTGAERMKERPIAPLVGGLRQLGAEIDYLDKEGFPPLYIRGKKLYRRTVSIQASISSQYVSALLMIGASLKNGLSLTLEGKLVSMPYIDMTLSLLRRIGIFAQRENNVIEIPPYVTEKNVELAVESDWSSASYYYSLMALSPPQSEFTLSTYYPNSLQGDHAVAVLYKRFFGVDTEYLPKRNMLRLSRNPDFIPPKSVEHDFSQTPDLAQTFAVTCLGLKIPMFLKGLQTLKIKETDRIKALYEMLRLCGASVSCGKDFLKADAFSPFKAIPEIETYGDHRMAMAFAPLAAKYSLCIKAPEVVVKSYPEFWRDISKAGVLSSD